MSALAEYRVALEFQPRWQLVARLAETLEDYEPEVEEILLAPGAGGGLVLVVRCKAPEPSTILSIVDEAGGEPPATPPPAVVGPASGEAAPSERAGGRRRRTPAPASSATREPGALSESIEQLLRVLHDNGDRLEHPSGRATGLVAEATGWTPGRARHVICEAESIGLLRRKMTAATRCSEIALTPVGLAAFDRLAGLDVDDDAADDASPGPGGGAVDAPSGGVTPVDRDSRSVNRDELMERRRAAAAAAI